MAGRPRFMKLRNQRWLDEPAYLTNQELADLLGCSKKTVSINRSHMRHAIAGGVAEDAARWEEWASRELLSNGIDNVLMPHGHHFDILVDGNVRIDVKHTESPFRTNDRKSDLWCFNVMDGAKRDDCDYYLLIIVPIKEVFIIPSHKIPAEQRQLFFSYPTDQPHKPYWQSYKDRWDLIIKESEATNE